MKFRLSKQTLQKSGGRLPGGLPDGLAPDPVRKAILRELQEGRHQQPPEVDVLPGRYPVVRCASSSAASVTVMFSWINP